MTMPKTRFEWLLAIVVIIALLNWIELAFFLIYWGGEAGSGTIQAGHYYLGKLSHAEVSHLVFLLSLWNVCCLMASHFLAMALILIRQKPWQKAGKRAI